MYTVIKKKKKKRKWSSNERPGLVWVFFVWSPIHPNLGAKAAVHLAAPVETDQKIRESLLLAVEGPGARSLAGQTPDNISPTPALHQGGKTAPGTPGLAQWPAGNVRVGPGYCPGLAVMRWPADTCRRHVCDRSLATASAARQYTQLVPGMSNEI